MTPTPRDEPREGEIFRNDPSDPDVETRETGQRIETPEE